MVIENIFNDKNKIIHELRASKTKLKSFALE